MRLEDALRQKRLHVEFPDDITLVDVRRRFEATFIHWAVNHYGTVSKAARGIHMDRTALHRKMRQLGVKGPGR